MYDSVLEGLHGHGMFFGPNKRLILVGEVMEWASNSEIVLDPDAHISSDTKEGADIAEMLARQPVADFGCLGVVWDASVICTLVP
jgi:hypothetical protein